MPSLRNIELRTVIFCGLVLFIAAIYITPSTKVYRNVYYLLVLTPALLYLATDGAARRQFFRSPATVWFLALAGWFWLSSLINDGFSIELILKLKTVVYMGAFLFALSVASAHADRAMTIGAAKAVVLVAALGGGFAFIWFYSSHPSTARLQGFGPLENQIRVAAMYGFVVLVACFLWSASCRAWAALGVAVGALVVYFAQSRGVLISLVTALAVYLVAQMLVSRVVSIFPLLFGGAFVLILFALTATGHENRFFSLADPRPAIWRDTLQMARESWLIGHGLLASTAVSNEFGVYHHAHSGYLAVFFQGGVIAVLICAVGVVRALINGIRGRRFLVLAMLVFGLMYLVFDGGSSPVNAPRDLWFVVYFPLFLLLIAPANPGWQQSGVVPSPEGWGQGGQSLALRN